jgi:hypothetical protein
MLAAALRRHADRVHGKNTSQSARLRRRAYRLALWSARITRVVPAAYPFALRELSTLLAERGKLAKALRVADKSCAVALGQKAKYEHAQSLLVRGTIARRLGQRAADEQIHAAEAALNSIETKCATTTPRAVAAS